MTKILRHIEGKKENTLSNATAIYNMELLEALPIFNKDELMGEIWRVPGGWILDTLDNSAFIPYNEEFKTTQEEQQ